MPIGPSHLRTHTTRDVLTILAGQAHEIRNPLTIVRGFCELLLRQPPGSVSPEEVRDYVHQIFAGLDRIDTILSGAYTMMTEQRPAFDESFDVNSVVEMVVQLLVLELQSCSIETSMHLTPDLPPIRGDFRQLEHVLLNIFKNAQDAMASGGRLIIATRAVGSAVEVLVEDTGSGVPQEILRDVFEPFVTTKSAGGGLGLGLAIVRRIMEGSYEGTVELRSRVGGGTVACLTFPATAHRRKNLSESDDHQA